MIVVVSGLPRSGTSLVMQMLLAGGYPVLADDHRPPDADNPRGYYEDRRVKRLERDASWLSEAEGRAIKVVSPLLRYLPPTFEYRVIFVERDLSEVVRSQQAMLQRRGETGAAVSPEHLIGVFQRHLAELRTWLAEQRAMQVLFLHYREILAHPRVAAERIIRFLNVPLNLDAMAAVADPRLYHQRSEAGGC